MLVCVIINPAAGFAGRRVSFEDKRTLAQRVCGERGVDVRVERTERRGHATELAARACAAGASLVVSWGGDGTMNEVGTALVGHDTALGLIPAGSGNGLALELGISRKPQDALLQALTGRDRLIDAGVLGGRYFFNIAGIGIDAAVARRFNERHTSSRGLSRYVVASLSEMLRYRALTYTIVADGTRRATPALLIALANGRQYGNGIIIAPTASLEDGLLDAVVVRPSRLPLTIWRARRLFSGDVLNDAGIELLRAAEVSVEADSPMWFHCDGETTDGAQCLVARSLPRVLRVRMPQL